MLKELGPKDLGERLIDVAVHITRTAESYSQNKKKTS